MQIVLSYNPLKQAWTGYRTPLQSIKALKIVENIEKPEIWLKIMVLEQNRIPDQICPEKFLHPETPHDM